MKRDYIITFIVEFIVFASAILVYKLAADFLGINGFSEYALSRRTISFIQPALVMGLGVGMPRYIAFAQASTNPRNPDNYFIGGFFVIAMVSLTFILLLNIFRDFFAFLFFGSSEYSSLIIPISIMLMGASLHGICYSYFRGMLKMINANFIQLINFGVIPLVVFFLFRNSLSSVLLATGLLWIVTSTVFLVFIISKLKLSSKSITSNTKELLSYGIVRVPGDFGLAAFLTLPAIFTAHLAGVKEAGFVSFGISLLGMINSIFAPISIILLPESAKIISKGDFHGLKHHLTKILKLSVGLTLIIIIFFELFMDQIIMVYLGENITELINVARIIVIGTVAYTVYISMRSVLDAYYVKAVNTKNIFISFLLFLIIAGLILYTNRNYIYLVIAFTISIFILGILTLWEVKAIFVRNRIAN